MLNRHTPEPDRPVLDSEYLARLDSHLGTSVMVELLADGMIELTDRLTRLAERAAADDHDGIARLGHDLVGMAGHLGLNQLSAAAAEMNRAARTPAGANAVSQVAWVRRLGAQSIDAMRQYIDEISSA
jgi:HPt (histidine-containing phosphotransfer) domain-containing protein